MADWWLATVRRTQKGRIALWCCSAIHLRDAFFYKALDHCVFEPDVREVLVAGGRKRVLVLT